jgi:pSer/pThr/pTyr-binding forkhead associated (FHA) protein
VDGLYCILSLVDEQKQAAAPVSVVSPPDSPKSDSGSSSSSSQSSSSSSSTSAKKRKKQKHPPPRPVEPRVFVVNRGSAVFGSSPGADQQETTNANVLKDPFVSKTHFKIVEEHGNYFVSDESSTNGTFIRKRSDSMRDADGQLYGRRLQHRSVVLFGRADITITQCTDIDR